MKKNEYLAPVPLEKAHRLLNHGPTVLVSARRGGADNVMAASWSPHWILTRQAHAIITALTNDQLLAEKHHDHALTGDWKDHRDCHVKPDLVFIYR
jgi:hypothetical protein